MHIIPIIVGVLGSIFTEGGLANILKFEYFKDYVIFYHTISSYYGVIAQFEYLFAVL